MLGRPATVAVDSHSGLAGIAHWINSTFRLEKDEVVKKRSPVVAKMKEIVDKEYAEGRNTVMGDNELENILRDVDFDEYERLSHIHLHHKNK